MLDKLRNIKSAKIRLALSICLCLVFFAASPTSPSDDDGCGSSSESELVGNIVVQNWSLYRQVVTISGPTSTSFYLHPRNQHTTRVANGAYTVTATISDSSSSQNGSNSYSDSFYVGDGETETCYIW